MSFKVVLPSGFDVTPDHVVEMPDNHFVQIYNINVESFQWVVVCRDKSWEVVDIPMMNNPERITCEIDMMLWLEQAAKMIENPPKIHELKLPKGLGEFVMQHMDQDDPKSH